MTDYGSAIATCSFVDVLSLPEFEGMDQFDLLPLKMDKVVGEFLRDTIGADVDKQCVVQACRHRTLAGEEVIGYRYVYPARKDRLWTRSKRAPLQHRIAAVGDPHLQADMVVMSKEGFPEAVWLEMCAKAAAAASPKERANRKYVSPSEIVETYKDDSETLKALKHIQKEVRGYLLPDEE